MQVRKPSSRNKPKVSCTDPDERVVDEVASVAELTANSCELEDRVGQVEALDGGLQVLEWLADTHHCTMRNVRPLEPTYRARGQDAS